MTSSLWKERLAELEDRGLRRELRPLDGPTGPVVQTADGEKLVFCSNDYLGLAAHPRLVEAAAEGARRFGAGSPSSRLIAGHTGLHAALERDLAAFLGSEDAVLFPSGFQANLGALGALTAPGDVILSDELVHASLVDGCRLSRARVRIFRHRDADHLEQLLAGEQGDGLRLVITDAVFSMDGDRAPLTELVQLAERRGALVYVDEAHALGTLGPGGRGLTAELGLEQRVAVRMGTLGKALGLAGAFVATGRDAAELIRSRARSLLYTTASPATITAAARASLELVRDGDDLRQRLRNNTALFRRLAGGAGVPLLPSDTAIQPVPVGGAAEVVRISRELWGAGIFVQGIRPPTVPEGTSRLRVSLSAAHQSEHIERLVQALGRSLERKGGPDG